MGKNSAIEWTDHTFNPWWGCEKISPACKHCYAADFAKRVGHGARLPQLWGPGSERRVFGEKHWREPLKWDAAAKASGVRARVFCASMADVFEAHPELDAERAKLWALIAATRHLDWLLLTKRPENVVRMVPAVWERAGWPENVWLGTTVESQEYAPRLDAILATGAQVTFASCEPLLGPLDLEDYLTEQGYDADGPRGFVVTQRPLDWVICGGESGGKARPMEAAWARSLRDQCIHRKVPFLFKQWGEHDEGGKRVGKAKVGRALDGRTWDEAPRSVPWLDEMAADAP